VRTPGDGSDEVTLADDDGWRIPAQYDVEPQPSEADETVLIQNAPTETPDRRRFPPDPTPGLLAILAGALLLLLLAPAGLWLASRDDDATAADPVTTGPTTGPTTDTQTTTAPSATTTVPQVTGLQVSEARELLTADGFEVRVRRTDSDRPQNEVLSQAPAADSDAERGSVVVLTVSEGEETVAVPDVEGSSAREAVATIRDAGLRARTRQVESEEETGTVVGQTPAAGDEVSKDTVVVLDVAKAAVRLVSVPDLVGGTSADARSELRSLGLRWTQRPVESSRDAGTVVRQSPRAGTDLREGGLVTLQVSTGPSTIAVPDVVGLDEAAASRELRRAGFVPVVVDEPTADEAEDGVVLGQSPTSGAERRRGATVTITVGRFS
jgi:serine/threonine-protein kinase